jgi:hypothetical protein
MTSMTSMTSITSMTSMTSMTSITSMTSMASMASMIFFAGDVADEQLPRGLRTCHYSVCAVHLHAKSAM